MTAKTRLFSVATIFGLCLVLLFAVLLVRPAGPKETWLADRHFCWLDQRFIKSSAGSVHGHPTPIPAGGLWDWGSAGAPIE